MVRIRLRLRRREGAGRPVVLVLTLCLMAGTLAGGTTVGADVASMQEGTRQTSGRRFFYLTDLNHDADEARDGCANGYHMASLWEMLDVSKLAYAHDHPDAHTKDDSGKEPPSHWYGWTRTGWTSSGDDAAGIGNCRNWTSTESDDHGTIIRLNYDWAEPGTVVGPWEADAFVCSSVAPVWCVQDLDRIMQNFLPVVVRP